MSIKGELEYNKVDIAPQNQIFTILYSLVFIQVHNVATSSADFAVDSGRPMSGETRPQMALFIARTYSPDDDDDSEDKMLMMVPWL